MRLTPAQIGMLLLLGEWLPNGPKQTVEERVREGYACLVRITGQDLGFDPQRWHEYLRASDAGGYCWSNKHLDMPRRIAEACKSAEWQQAIKKLESANDNTA